MTHVFSGGCARYARTLATASCVVFIAAAAWAQTPAEPAKPADPNAVVATVNGKTLTERDVALALEEINPSGKAVDPARREQVVDFLIKFKLLAGAAEEAKIGESPEFQSKLDFLRDKALMQTYLEKIGKAAVTDEAVKKVYDETIKDLKPEEEVHARHILLEKEEDAKKAAERIANGEDFIAVAKEMSTELGSGAEGGDLGFVTKEQVVPEFGEAAFKLEPGKVSGPVKSKFGWHIIKVEEKRQRPIPKLEEVRDQIEDYVFKRAQEEAVTKLVGAAKIERPGGDKKSEEPAEPVKK
jgi:peptidyl-prolyl cis-trans isomerase C